MKNIGNYKIPFSEEGQLHYPEYYRPNQLEWKDNFEFEGFLSFENFARGRSAAYANMTAYVYPHPCKTTFKVTVFLSDLEWMMGEFDGGSVSGTFTFVKKGQNYGCKRIQGK